MSVQPGDQLDRFRVIRAIGRGGFSTVFLAHDELLDDHVAIKVLADNHSIDIDSRERFVDEGRMLRRVTNASVVSVHDVGALANGQPYHVLEHLEGGDLAQRVAVARQTGRPVTLSDVVSVVQALGNAMDALHRARIVHRDIKPGNILLRSVLTDDRAPVIGGPHDAVLSDLGTGKDVSLTSGVTAAGGTEGFRAPEQRVAGTVNETADVFGASAVIGWLLESVDPGSVPAALRIEVERGRADDPTVRHPTATDWADALVDAASAPAAQVAAPPARRPSVATAVPVAAFVMLALVALVVALVRAPSDPNPTVDLGDGRVEQVVDVDGLRASIVGPPEVAVGVPVVYTADVEGAARFEWRTPDGATYVDTPAIELTPTAPGSGAVVLVATDADGVEHRVVLNILVTDP